MSFTGFIVRAALIAILTWIAGAIIESFWWALFLVLYLIWLFEVLPPRRSLNNHLTPASHEPTNDPVPEFRLDRDHRAVVHNPERLPVADPDRCGGVHRAGPDADPKRA